MASSSARAISACRRLANGARPHCSDLRKCQEKMRRVLAKKKLPKKQFLAAYDAEDELRHALRAYSCGSGFRGRKR